MEASISIQMENAGRKINIVSSQRQQKTTLERKEIYCEFWQQHPSLRACKPTDDSVQFLWAEPIILLNAVKGSTHSKEEWVKIFDNWRYVTMHKARHLKNNKEKTGSGESSIEKLTAMEEKAISLWGKLVVDGNPDLGSVGVETCDVEFLDEYLHIASIPSIQSSQTAQASQPEACREVICK